MKNKRKVIGLLAKNKRLCREPERLHHDAKYALSQVLVAKVNRK